MLQRDPTRRISEICEINWERGDRFWSRTTQKIREIQLREGSSWLYSRSTDSGTTLLFYGGGTVTKGEMRENGREGTFSPVVPPLIQTASLPFVSDLRARIMCGNGRRANSWSTGKKETGERRDTQTPVPRYERIESVKGSTARIFLPRFGHICIAVRGEA